MSRHRLSPRYYYVLFSVSPAQSNVLSIRKKIQDALTEVFGITQSGDYMDILWTAEDCSEILIRMATTESPVLLAAVVTFRSSPRLSVIKRSTFLPSLLSRSNTLREAAIES
ncbi:hypothetical protein NEOLEDRAFT_1073672 [Neolentinus lepideus HHB14362 ss-1]|uniref:Uncharacterized protein n=1 Tax=Neolentinus lepideus HHB14362 ss-1 TaxID=1314782 RepID=A0A165PNJ4_9AGAM|nr:hypothetical protein NEOLEDRAFT_1073672 [Neolentinus lepideus HHB14362 ss-1]